VAKRIGLYGGTFDPIHLAHLQAALEASEQASLDEVRLLPCANPPHRQPPLASAAHRLAMLQLAVAEEPKLIADERELHRDALSYSIDTIEDIRREISEDDTLFWLLGEDAFYDLPSWHRFDDILKQCHLLVLPRPQNPQPIPDKLRELLKQRTVTDSTELTEGSGKIAFIQPTAFALSATQIRTRLFDGRSVRYLLPKPVLDYIQRHDLYRATV